MCGRLLRASSRVCTLLCTRYASDDTQRGMLGSPGQVEEAHKLST